MYAIRNKENPRIFFHLPQSALERKTKLCGFREGAVPRLFRLRSHARSALSNWIVAGPSMLDCMRKGLKPRLPAEWEIIEVELKEVPRGPNQT